MDLSAGMQILWLLILHTVNMRRSIFLFLLLLMTCSGRNDRSFTQPIKDEVKKISYRHDAVQHHWKNENIPVLKVLDSLKIKVTEIKIVIRKSAYELGIYKDTMLLKNYPVVFGGNPVDDKLRQGDNCTPEGIFKIRSKYHHAKWSRFIWIDYPNADSWKKHNQAKAKGLISKNASIGGDVGIHGIPQGYDAAVDTRQNWTLGCISMRNKDVIEIYPVVHNDILIEIKK